MGTLVQGQPPSAARLRGDLRRSINHITHTPGFRSLLSLMLQTSTPPSHSRAIAHRLHCAMPLSGNFAIQARPILQSSLNLHFLFGAIFFNRGSAIPRIWKTARARAQMIEKTLAIIQSESATHGTWYTVAVLMLPAV